MFLLGVLAFNEEKNIESVLKDYINNFDQVVVVDDGSSDATYKIVKEFSKKNKNLKIIKNDKNYGAGHSFKNLVEFFLNSSNSYLIKIDGDNQFTKDDVMKIKSIFEKNNVDFIKCDRFWHNGILGSIPTIRYVGNIFASYLIKFCTGNRFFTDPLNGLFAFSKKSLMNFTLEKKFKRYGYPFFVCNFINKKIILENLKFHIFKNQVKYVDRKKSIKPSTMLVKLIIFTIINYYKNLKLKLRNSELHSSLVVNIATQLNLILLFASLYKLITIRYFGTAGLQSNWVIVLLTLTFILIYLVSFLSKQSFKFYKTKHLEI